MEYNVPRFGADAIYRSATTLLQAGPEFVGHPSHSHHDHGPGWVMTWLMFVDDGDRVDRGETLSAPTAEASWLDVVAQGPALNKRPVKYVPFRANTLLAWLDSPMSFHGTERLEADPINGRKMLRNHTQVSEADVQRCLGIGSKEFETACHLHYSGESAALRRILEKSDNCVDRLPRFSFFEEYPDPA